MQNAPGATLRAEPLLALLVSLSSAPVRSELPASYREQYSLDWLARSSAGRYSRRASEPKGAVRRGPHACDRTNEVSTPQSRWADAHRPGGPCPRGPEAQTARPRARGPAHPPLQPPHRASLHRVDPALYLLSRQAASRRDGRSGGHSLSHLSRSSRTAWPPPRRIRP